MFINDKYEQAGQEKPFKKTKLTALAEYFSIENEGAHRADFDCEMTARVYAELLRFPEPKEAT
jgi:DNA polymerase III epsilon subunit-like protein